MYVLRSVRQRWAQDLILDDPCVLHDFLEEVASRVRRETSARIDFLHVKCLATASARTRAVYDLQDAGEARLCRNRSD